MTIAACLSRLLKAGKITEAQAADAKSIYDGVLSGDMLRDMDRATAEGYAALKTAEILEQSAKAKKLELAQATANFNANLERQSAHPNGPLAGFMGLFDRDIRNAPAADRINASSLDVEYYRPTLASKMHEFDEAYRSKAAGLKQDIAGIRNMIRENFGVKTGDSVAEHASKGWQNAIKWGEDKARSFGKAFTSAKDWRQPQFWTSSRANKFGAAEMKSDIDRHIDLGGLKVFDPETGLMAGGADRDRIVRDGIQHIREDQSAKAGPASIFKTEQRVFRFQEGEAGANAYLELMDKYGPGAGGYYAMMQGHAERMSRELSMLHVFGPRWRASSQALLDDAIAKNATLKLEPSGKNTFEKMGDVLLRGIGLEGENAAKRMQKYMTGQLSGTESELVSGINSGMRSFLTATNMGSSVVTAIPADTVNWMMASSFRGLNSGRLAAAITEQLFADTPDKEAFAARIGITAHAASRVALGTKQYSDQMFGSGSMQRMADFVIRAQGLHSWDNAINRSFTMEFLASLADRGGKSFADLDAPFSRFLTDYGFTADDWAKLSAADHIAAGPAKFLAPDSLEEGLRAKLMSAIGDEKQFAYLAGTPNRVKALTTGGVKGGTLAGETARNFFMFKSFPLTMMATHGVRAAQEAAGGNWGQVASLGLFMTMAGAVAIQARQVLTGKDPKSMDDGWFWLESAFQGGALGIYGDFLKSGTSRSGTDLTETLLGPVASIPKAIGDLTSGARKYAEEGRHVNFGAALASDIQRFTPGQNLWYTRLLANRFIFDNIRRQIDPDYAGSFARQTDRLRTQGHQEFFWQPGESSPSRAPDLGAMLR